MKTWANLLKEGNSQEEAPLAFVRPPLMNKNGPTEDEALVKRFELRA